MRDSLAWRSGLLLVLALAGCSSFRIAYGQADWYVARQISKAICPTSGQRTALKHVATEFFSWHRRHELPRYARAFRRIAGELDRPVSRQLLHETYALIDKARERASRQLDRPLVAFGMRLGPQQASCLASEVVAMQRKRLAELGGSEAAYREKHQQKLIDTIDDWIGDLSGKQQTIVSSVLDSQPRARAVAVARLNKGMRLVSALRSPDLRKKRKWLRGWVNDPYAFHTTAEVVMLKQRDHRRRAQLWQLVRTLSARQRKHFKQKLLSYAKDFEILAGNGS